MERNSFASTLKSNQSYIYYYFTLQLGTCVIFFPVPQRNWRKRWVGYFGGGAKGYVAPPPLWNYWGAWPPAPSPPPLFLCLWEIPFQVLHCLPFHLHLVVALLHCKTKMSYFRSITVNVPCVQMFRLFKVEAWRSRHLLTSGNQHRYKWFKDRNGIDLNEKEDYLYSVLAAICIQNLLQNLYFCYINRSKEVEWLEALDNNAESRRKVVSSNQAWQNNDSLSKGRMRQRKERDEVHLSRALPSIQWASSPYDYLAIGDSYPFSTGAKSFGWEFRIHVLNLWN